jgi:hypothetical protein
MLKSSFEMQPYDRKRKNVKDVKRILPVIRAVGWSQFDEAGAGPR